MFRAGFFNIELGAWNTLPRVVVEADTIMIFKSLLDQHMDMQGTEGYGTCGGRD